MVLFKKPQYYRIFQKTIAILKGKKFKKLKNMTEEKLYCNI